jgi:uncharacterized BrkB/YihY/UPF0761 family membrane protein
MGAETAIKKRRIVLAVTMGILVSFAAFCLWSGRILLNQNIDFFHNDCCSKLGVWMLNLELIPYSFVC